MKHLFRTLAAILIIALPLTIGCKPDSDNPNSGNGQNTEDPNNPDNPDNPDNPGEAELTLSEYEVNVPAGGGSFSVSYTISNPGDTHDLPTASAQEEWITECSVVDSVVEFTVAANELTAAREAVIEVIYHLDTCRITVAQAGATSLSLTTESIDVPVSGGNYTIEYQITNPIEGESLTATTAADWITDINTETEGRVTFAVAANEDNVRQAGITLTYNGKDYTVTVTQAAEEKTITLELIDASTTTVEVNIIRSDDTMKYYAWYTSKEYLDSFASDQEFFESEVNYFSQLAESYGISTTDYLNYIALFDRDRIMEISISVDEIGVPCYVFAYGIDPVALTLLTPVAKVEFTVPVQ